MQAATKPPFIARIPGSKSFTNRALILAAQRPGSSVVRGALMADDTKLLAAALNAFDGLSVQASDENRFLIQRHKGRLRAPTEPVFLGAAGTPARLLLAFAAGADGPTTITGIERLCERPMADLLRAFDKMGVRYESLAATDHLPLRIYGSQIATNHWPVDGRISSQFISALMLLAAQQDAEAIEIEILGRLVSRPYVDITIQIMRECGIQVDDDDPAKLIIRPAVPATAEIEIEPDASSMSYFLAAAAITGTRVTIPQVSAASTQGDLQFARLLGEMGCRVDWQDNSLTVTGGSLVGIDVDMERIPDVVLTLAVVAACAAGPTHIYNVANLRVKECDRIHAAVTELQRLGVDAEEGSDWIKVRPSGHLRAASVRTYEDHRVAMSFGLLTLLNRDIQIEDPACASKSFPGFWDELARFGSWCRD